MAIHKYNNTDTSAQGFSVPQRETLSVVRKGSVDYEGSSVALSTTNIVHHFVMIINLDLPAAIFTTPGTTALVDKVDKIVPIDDPEMIVFVNIKPWSTGGIFYDDGTTRVYWRRTTSLNSSDGGKLIVYYSLRCVAGSLQTPGPKGSLQYSVVNSDSVAGKAGGKGGGGYTGKYFYYEVQEFDRYGNVVSYTPPILTEYINDNWKYEPNAYIGDAQ